ncbi:TetR/AcrR family transcriptional regulator [Staphylococcus chromogenes]|nr:TetR/AcrR family transcriptional regulator [Staphylococcus chromogenes]
MKQTRRTGEELLDAIAMAVRAELAEHGIGGITYEGVARRAKTSKPVLYRRFPTRAEMIYFSVATQTTTALKAHIQPSLRENLRLILEAMRENVEQFGVDNALTLLGEAGPELRAKITDQTISPLLKHWLECIEFASTSGELRQAVESERLIRLPFSCAIADVIAKGELTTEAIEDIIDNIVLPAYAVQS